MADGEQIGILKHDVGEWNAWRRENHGVQPDLSGASLREANLSGADLSGASLRKADLHRAILFRANLSGASLREANLSRAILDRANLSGAILVRANLSGANLHWAALSGANCNRAKLVRAELVRAELVRANLSKADLSGANLSKADLNGANLVDTLFDEATLSDVFLWETQRSGWSIKNVKCDHAFWDRDRKERTKYLPGEFERAFAEKPQIVLDYPGGMQPVDFAMLPMMVEQLQAEHEQCVLNIRSVQDAGGGATVTITVDDTSNRSAEAKDELVNLLRGKLKTARSRLIEETELRRQIETKLEFTMAEVIPKLLNHASRPTQSIQIDHMSGGKIAQNDESTNVEIGTFTQNDLAAIGELLVQVSELRARLDEEEFEDDVLELTESMEVLEDQIEGTSGDDSAIRRALGSIQRIAEGAAGGSAGTGIAEVIKTLLA